MVSIVRVALHVGLGLRSSTLFAMISCRLFNLAMVGVVVVLCCCPAQGGITCGTIDEPRKSSKAIDERVIIDFRDKNVVIARFRDKNGGFLFYR